MSTAVIVIIILAALFWPTYGYLKGRPHGLGGKGIMYSMIGLFGMRMLNNEIRKKSYLESRAARDK